MGQPHSSKRTPTVGREPMKVKVPQILWYDHSETELGFPQSWSVFGKCGEGELQLPQPLPAKVKRFIILSDSEMGRWGKKDER